jgi:hypothetical protein
MKAFLRYFGIASGVQVGLCLVAGFIVGVFSPKLDSLLTVMLYIYAPTIYSISSLGNFTGTSAMVYPILFGIPLGVLLYAFIFAFAMKHFRA